MTTSHSAADGMSLDLVLVRHSKSEANCIQKLDSTQKIRNCAVLHRTCQNPHGPTDISPRLKAFPTYLSEET